MIRLCLVEDNTATRDGFVKLLGHSPEILCLGAYESAEQAEKAIPALKPDVVLMDVSLPGKSGIECIAKLKPACPGAEWIVLTTHEDTDVIFNALRAGASGYLLKQGAPEELVPAIKDVLQGGAPMSGKVARRIVSHFHPPGRPAGGESLSPRENEILSHLAKGLTCKAVADLVHLSPHTVNNHLRNIYRKLQVQTRTEAVVKFLGR